MTDQLKAAAEYICEHADQKIETCKKCGHAGVAMVIAEAKLLAEAVLAQPDARSPGSIGFTGHQFVPDGTYVRAEVLPEGVVDEEAIQQLAHDAVGDHTEDGETRASCASAVVEALRPYLRTPAPTAISEWQPIETAPRDGRPVDLWIRPITTNPNDKGFRHPNCFFVEGKWRNNHMPDDFTNNFILSLASHYMLPPTAPATLTKGQTDGNT